ncbi:MAG: tetratricopeptide repeat protein [Mesorhizobium sp.]|nr:MAG: tetratricopeptide repeat protein [Mesorhizobium sp.]
MATADTCRSLFGGGGSTPGPHAVRGRNARRCGTLAGAAVKGSAPASAWFDLALVRQDLHDHVGAAAAYRKALEIRPDDAEAAVNLGVALQEAGDMDAAIEAYRTAYGQRATTFGTIAMALTSAPHGKLWIDRETLKGLLGKNKN